MAIISGRPGKLRVRKVVRGVSRIFASIVLIGALFGCGSVADIRAEQRAEALARKYGERLPESELGPFKGFTREEYFKHKCETEAGEFIYRTVDNVESVFQMRPRERRSLTDRLKEKDIPEDPWGHTDMDARQPFWPFLEMYQYFEGTTGLIDRGERWDRKVFAKKPAAAESNYWHYSLGNPDGKEYRIRRKGEEATRPLVVKGIKKPISRYGYTWREFRDRFDRHFGVWGGELLVKDLELGKVIAVSRGFFDSRYSLCPKRKYKLFVFDFVSKVLKPGSFMDAPLIGNKGENK